MEKQNFIGTMTLTQQFLLISLLPLSFLGMAVYLWRSDLKRRDLLWRWTFVLLAAAVWASSVLRFYGGITLPLAVSFTWGVVGRYAFSVTAVSLLIATINHVAVARHHGRFAWMLSGVLWVVTLALDPQLWDYKLPDYALAGQNIGHFDLYIAFWIASWLLPVLAAWISTQQVRAGFPNSLYRNQAHYWQMVLSLFIIGGGLASVQQPGQPGWQEAGLLFVILATFIGTVSLAHSHLPDLPIALRRLLGRLSGALVIFGLVWLALDAIVRSVAQMPKRASLALFLAAAAAVFAIFMTFLFPPLNVWIQRLFLPPATRRERALASYNEALALVPEPVELARLFLEVVQSELRTNDAWFFSVEDSAAALTLRPLASLDDHPLEAISFDDDSLFAAYLHRNQTPLAQYDIDTLSHFDAMPAAEKDQLRHWGRILYMPLHAGSRLAGVVALGKKTTGESYDRQDFARLQMLAPQISPFLVQAQNMSALRQVNEAVVAENRTLHYERRYLRQRLDLYQQFVDLISPALRRPFIPISQKIEQIQASLDEMEGKAQLTDALNQQIERHRTALERLIALAGRLQTRHDFDFQPTDLDTAVQQAIRSLKAMAEARRVHIEYDPITTLPAVLGDAAQLQEAVRHLLHNAIKYNKIGGTVQLSFDTQSDQICLHVSDTGVGVPKEKLDSLWQGLSNFNQADNGRNPGLGLTLAQYIVAAHGGHVEAESKYGAGSVFSIYLPVADA